MYTVRLEKFEGPLHLLLELIENNDLDVSQISLAKIADEYINYVNNQKGIPLEELSDFLLVASKLIYIKSKALLPYLAWGEEEDGAIGLEEQLKLYKEFFNASRKIEEMIKQKKYFFARERVAVPKGFYPPLLRQGSAGQAPKITANMLKNVYMEILRRIEPFIKMGGEIKSKIISIKQKIEDLKSQIGRRARLGFKEFVGKAKNKTEVIVSFLALLELIKQKVVSAEQGELFEEITISKK